MLVLTRKVEERILIGEHTVVTVIEIKGGKVRLGIENKGDPILRGEVATRLEGQDGQKDQRGEGPRDETG